MRVAVLILLLALAACSAPPEPAPEPISCASGTTGGQGSSAQTSALQAWIKAYQIACPDATIAYAGTGSGAGVRAFLDGEGDFAGTDSALSGQDLRKAAERCGGPVVHLPLVAGPIALAYNVAGVGELRLTPETIAEIFSGKVTAWDDPAIAATNPLAALPSTAIRTIHRADGSGTTDNFTRYLAAAAPGRWPHGAGSTWRAPGGTGEKGSHRVVAAVGRTDGAIGYVESSYALLNDLPVVRIGPAGGPFTEPTNSAVAGALLRATITDDLRIAPRYDGTADYAYPLVLISYELVCRTGTPALTRSFLAYAAGPSGQAAAGSALPEELRTRVEQSVLALT
ncbi:phosphate ABC transporter substrate-binding protein PstS [Actinoplanes sp. NPDC023714]|uniref:phosphate ABC transporter substrate-binding protein PstS n=1 Tax=Actinoplanes sp. NPDC023714 TaxID=3154322 RepID=UPI0033E11676